MKYYSGHVVPPVYSIHKIKVVVISFITKTINLRLKQAFAYIHLIFLGEISTAITIRSTLFCLGYQINMLKFIKIKLCGLTSVLAPFNFRTQNRRNKFEENIEFVISFSFYFELVICQNFPHFGYFLNIMNLNFIIYTQIVLSSISSEFLNYFALIRYP